MATAARLYLGSVMLPAMSAFALFGFGIYAAVDRAEFLYHSRKALLRDEVLLAEEDRIARGKRAREQFHHHRVDRREGQPDPR